VGLTPTTSIVATRAQVSADLGDEVAILGVASGQYYTVRDVAARIWALVQEPVTVAAVVATLEAEYEVAGDRLGADVERYVEKLLEAGLVTVST
jgi:hypothetical protein